MRWFLLIAALVALVGCTQSPPPPPSRSFSIFFDTDKSDLTSTGQGIVVGIALAVKSDRPSKMTVQGQASGDSPRDAELAGQRADVVIKAIVAQGVDPLRIERLPVLIGPTSPDPAARIAAQKVEVNFQP